MSSPTRMQSSLGSVKYEMTMPVTAGVGVGVGVGIGVGVGDGVGSVKTSDGLGVGALSSSRLTVIRTITAIITAASRITPKISCHLALLLTLSLAGVPGVTPALDTGVRVLYFTLLAPQRGHLSIAEYCVCILTAGYRE